MYINVHYNTEY